MATNEHAATGMPSFLVLGAAKAGTSAVFNYLRQHPAVFTAAIKEPHFFTLEGLPVDFRGPVADMPINRVAVNNIEDYRRLFSGSESFQARGEASTSYLYSARAAGSIRRHVPHARLVAILRDPVQRAYSSYLYMVARGLETRSFADALRDEQSRIDRNWPPIWHYRQMGFYGAQLSRYFELFPKNQIRIFFFDDLVRDPVETMKEMYAFVGVDSGFSPDTRAAPNPSGVPRRPRLYRWIFGGGPVKRTLRRVMAAGVRERLGSELRRRALSRPPLDDGIARSLRDGYASDIRQLEALVDRDLSAWTAPAAGRDAEA